MTHVRLVIGRAGSGKSHGIGAKIRKQVHTEPFGSRIFWLVPSDATFATEKILVEHVGSAIRPEIISLHRLAERIIRDADSNRPTAVNTTGKRILLADVYHRLTPKLTVLKRETPSISFLDAIMEAFTEMSSYGIELSQLEATLESAAALALEVADVVTGFTRRSLLGKLEDLCLLYIHWVRALESHRLYDPDDALRVAQPYVSSWRDLQGASVYVDGFESLTPRERKFLMEIAKASGELEIALSMDIDWVPAVSQMKTTEAPNAKSIRPLPRMLRVLADLDVPVSGLYAPQTVLLYHDLLQDFVREGISYAIESLANHSDITRFHAAPELAHLEKHLFSSGVQLFSQTASTIVLAAAQSMQAEADGVAREIQRLHREQGVAWRDCVVVVPDVSMYAGYLTDSFRRYEVEGDVEQFGQFADHPVAKLVLTALQIVEENMSMMSIFRLLKSDLCGLTRDEADWLENYMRRYEVKGVRAWRGDPWMFAARSRGITDGSTDEDRQAEKLRRRIGDYLLPFIEQLQGDVCEPKVLAQALWSLFERIRVKAIVADWLVDEQLVQSPFQASLHEQAWQRTMALVNDLSETMADLILSRNFLFQVVRSDILHQVLSTIPAGANAVLVTEMARARTWDSDYVFTMGAMEGLFPRVPHNSGLLLDEERVQFESMFGIQVGPTVEERQFALRSTIYGVLTRAKKRLYLSHPLSGTDGKEVRAANVIDRIKALFPQRENEWLWMSFDAERGDITSELTSTLTPRSALEVASSLLRVQRDEGIVSPVTGVLLDWLVRSGSDARWLDELASGLGHVTRARRLTVESARQLYGQHMAMNVHQLESFAACPFQHFVQYGLRLQVDDGPDVGSAGRGNLIHDVLQKFVAKHVLDMDHWREMTDEEAIASIKESFLEVVSSPKAEPWHANAVRRQQAEATQSVLANAAIVLTRQIKYGKFIPARFEISFGVGQEGSLPSLDIELGGDARLSLRGRIDRIDFADEDGRLAIRIIDYKSSAFGIDLTKVEYGLRLQLAIYALAINQNASLLFGKDGEVAAVLYLPMVRSATLANAPQDEGDAKEGALQQMRARGLLLADNQYVEWMDYRLVDPKGSSELFSRVFKQDGDLSKTAPALRSHEWLRFLDRARSRTIEFARQIQAGEIGISPYHLGPQDDACTFCNFAQICHIDRRTDSSPVRYLVKHKKDEWLSIWEQADTKGDVL